MSLSGISRVKKSALIFVDKEKKGISENAVGHTIYYNVEYAPDLTYTNNRDAIRSHNVSTINIQQTLTSPATNFVNLGFEFTNVIDSGTQNQSADSLKSSQTTILVENVLNYSYTKNLPNKTLDVTKLTNVLSTNSEHNITLDLDNEELPIVETIYQNYEVASDIELNEDEVWS